MKKTTFAVCFGNRGFFPASLQASARREMQQTITKLGHDVLLLDEPATRYGAVETPAEGRVFAEFLRQHRGKYGGVILCLPNFGDETGSVAALKEAGVPILIQAYPDELEKMAPEIRRDSFCGKFSVMDVLRQYGVKFTALKPHTVHPLSPAFADNLAQFDAICRVVNGMRNLVVGAIGARTTAFKTVRIDELTLQKYGITVETIDLADVFARVARVSPESAAFRQKAETLRGYSCWTGVPDKAFGNLTRLAIVLDDLQQEFGLDAMAVRCWLEMQQQLGISPCVVLSEMNNRGITAACEVDVGNAIMMQALHLASDDVVACLDWNNNYGEDLNKCILFHCGPVPRKMMSAPGRVADHAILANAVGKGCSFGCNVGRIAPAPFTFGSALTEDGRLKCYVGQARFTADPVPADFFGCAGVAEFSDLQSTLQTIGLSGHRHHTSVTPAHVLSALKDALVGYLGYDVTVV
jgi:L-fucose isomerase-like protein